MFLTNHFLTDKGRALVKTAKMVALNCLEPRAAMYDKLAIYPTDSWTDLSKHGLLSIGIPGKFGGAWTDMSTYVMVIENLSHGCTSSAMTLHMHSVVQMFIEDLASPKQKKNITLKLLMTPNFSAVGEVNQMLTVAQESLEGQRYHLPQPVIP